MNAQNILAKRVWNKQTPKQIFIFTIFNWNEPDDSNGLGWRLNPAYKLSCGEFPCWKVWQRPQLSTSSEQFWTKYQHETALIETAKQTFRSDRNGICIWVNWFPLKSRSLAELVGLNDSLPWILWGPAEEQWRVLKKRKEKKKNQIHANNNYFMKKVNKHSSLKRYWSWYF